MPNPAINRQERAQKAEAVLKRWLERVELHGSDLKRVKLDPLTREALRTLLGPSPGTHEELDELASEE